MGSRPLVDFDFCESRNLQLTELHHPGNRKAHVARHGLVRSREAVAHHAVLCRGMLPYHYSL
jgi:hypothetical protein